MQATKNSSLALLRLGSVLLVVLLLVSGCGDSEEVVVTGGDLDFSGLDPLNPVTASDPLSSGTTRGVVVVRDPRFNDLVPDDLDVFHFSVGDEPPASLLWRRGVSRLMFVDSATGVVRAWDDAVGVVAVRSDLFGGPAGASSLAAESVDPASEDGRDEGAGEDGDAGEHALPADDADTGLAPVFMTVLPDGSLVVFDGWARRIAIVPVDAPEAPLQAWVAPEPAAWGRITGFALRPSPDLQFWFTATGGPAGPGLYRFDNVSLGRVWDDPVRVATLAAPFGVAFSPDGASVIVGVGGVDRPGPDRWLRWPADSVVVGASVAAGSLPDVPADLVEFVSLEPYGGLAVDLVGHLYAASPAGVEVFDPDGTWLGSIRLPEPVRDLVWGRDGSWLYAASATGVYVVPVFHAAAGVPPGSPEVVVHTDAGSFRIRLDAHRVPVTVANFLRYAHHRFYEGTVFHRVIRGFVVQAGGFDQLLQPKPLLRDPIANEAANGLFHERGSVAMARIAAPDSATSQWFVNVVDNRGRGLAYDPDVPDRFGYAVFGRVLEGMDVVDQISERPVERVRQHLYVPLRPVVINRVEVLP